jgi:6-phosphogluconolactonase
MTNDLFVYVGTYTAPKTDSKGIYLLRFDLESGRLTSAGLAAEATNPSFLAIHPSRRFLYAVNEQPEFAGRKTGAVSAFAIDPPGGGLRLLNQEPSGGAGPCHLVVDAVGKHVLVANYGGGSVEVLSIGPDGTLGEPTAAIQHKDPDPGPKPRRPRAHSINLDAAQCFAFVADLGLDRVFFYRFDSKAGTLTPNEPAWVKLADKAGPRHFAWHPSGRFAYVINELNSTVTAFSYDAGRGTLREIQTVSTLPADFAGKSDCAEVQVHPSGKFLYGSNRGHDSIAIFAIDSQTGRLAPLGHESTQGKTPRNFAIDPTGRYLLAANQDSNTIVVFRVDGQTGLLKATGQTAEVPAPVCVKFVPPPDAR